MWKIVTVGGIFLSLVGVLLGIAWWEGWIAPAWSLRHAELAGELRDRGTVATVGRPPWSMRGLETPFANANRDPGLSAALTSASPARVVTALAVGHYDGLLVRDDGPAQHSGTVLSALQSMHPVDGLHALCLDDSAVLYESTPAVDISADDARRMVSIVRLVLSGASAPPERIFPETLRRAQPVEIAVIVREGHEPLIWSSTRGGSIARALLDVTYAVLDRWSTRQQEHYGRLREALTTRMVTVAVFYDKGVLASRTPDFLRRVAPRNVYAVGYDRLSDWEYELPPTPWQPAGDPVAVLNALTREHGVPSPGYLRSELTLYRFRALQMIEQSPGGPVEIYDPREGPSEGVPRSIPAHLPGVRRQRYSPWRPKP